MNYRTLYVTVAQVGVAKLNRALLASSVIIPDFGAKILQIAHPVNYSYLPPWCVCVCVCVCVL